MSDRPKVHIHLLPRLVPAGIFRGNIAVVVDVLRATTVMVQALASGCSQIIPCLEIDDAVRIASDRPPDTVLLAGERRGLPIEGFDLGNSPRSFTPEVCGGKTLVMTTTNGTKTILASLEAERVLIGAFTNRDATLEALRADGRSVHIVCAGTDGRISLEDAVLAGDLAGVLWKDGYGSGNDEVDLARWASGHLSDNGAGGDRISLSDALSLGRGGRRVREIGLSDDIEDAARVDRYPIVVELVRDPLRIVAVS